MQSGSWCRAHCDASTGLYGNQSDDVVVLRLFAWRMGPMVFEPLCGIQLDRHRLAVCCAACFAPLGTPTSQLAWAAGALDRVRAACAPYAAPVRLPTLGDIGVAPGVPCCRACGEMYCSDACLLTGDRHGHRLLCVGDITHESHPLYVFKLAALQSERANTFQLATSLLARLICAALDGRQLDDHELSARKLVVDSNTDLDEEARRVHQLWRAAMVAVCPPCEGPACELLLRESTFQGAVALVTSHAEDSVRGTPLRHYLRHALRQPGVPPGVACEAVGAVNMVLASLLNGEDAVADEGGDSLDGGVSYDDGDSAGSDPDADPDPPHGMGDILEHLDRLCPPLRVRAVFPYALSGAVHSSRLLQNCLVTFDDGGHGGSGPLRAYIRPLNGGQQLPPGDVPTVDELTEESVSATTTLTSAPVELCCSMARQAAERGAHEAARQLWQAVLTRTDGQQQQQHGDVAAARGDAWHGLACALLNLGDWSGAHAAFATGAEEVPHHTALSSRAATTAAYGSHPARPPGARVPSVQCARVLLSKGRRAVLSGGPVLSTQQCDNIIAEAEARAQMQGGWCTQRHYSVPTTDQPLASLPAACAAFNAAMRDAIAPLLQQQFPGTCGGGSIEVHDAFVVKYDAAGGQASLPMHRDQGQLSLTLALNQPPRFTGGGTVFEPLAAAGEPALCPAAGHVLAFNSGLMHGGAPITAGVRYIIAAFLWVKE